MTKTLSTQSVFPHRTLFEDIKEKKCSHGLQLIMILYSLLILLFAINTLECQKDIGLIPSKKLNLYNGTPYNRFMKVSSLLNKPGIHDNGREHSRNRFVFRRDLGFQDFCTQIKICQAEERHRLRIESRLLRIKGHVETLAK